MAFSHKKKSTDSMTIKILTLVKEVLKKKSSQLSLKGQSSLSVMNKKKGNFGFKQWGKKRFKLFY